ncbi:MAG TPA: GH3 auxin-responsive promoter family protein [Candidatus Sulfotelmatobacter sp.]|nr:GH3 auxin-responsive promoter family protein [Candidatus Sulfotelmatobacter sp.]
MIARAAGSFMDWAAARRRQIWERVSRRAAAIQEATLVQMLRAARDTEFGRRHGFESIRSVAEYQERVPLGDYLAFAPLWTRAANGEDDVAWPGRPRYWVKTSGTTAGDKCIPVTPEAFASHRRGGWDAFYLAMERAGAARLLGGPLLFMGGSSSLKPYGQGCLVGDLSGLVVRRLPPLVRSRYSPGPDLAAITDWERRLAAVAALAACQDLRLITGMPSWMVILFDRVAAARKADGHLLWPLGDVWPNLRVCIHGGVAFPPYARVFEEWIGRPLERVEVYPASEGFVALQTEASGGLTLMLDYGIFYEFIPVEDLGSSRPRRHTVADLELNRAYAVALTAPAGLWAYLLGDTVRFTARDPLRLQIIGRTRHFVNAFGENVIVEEVERAVARASQETGANVAEFSLAPRYPCQTEPRGGHDWLIEFRGDTPDLGGFARILDETVRALNTDYRTKRAGDVGMLAPRVLSLPPGTFHEWMRECGKLGDQHKVPRVTNDRVVAEGLLAAADRLSTAQVTQAQAGPTFRRSWN